MTVAELRARLEDMPADAIVLVCSEVGSNEVVSVQKRWAYRTGEGKQGGWCGPFEEASVPDADCFEAVWLEENERP